MALIDAENGFIAIGWGAYIAYRVYAARIRSEVPWPRNQPIIGQSSFKWRRTASEFSRTGRSASSASWNRAVAGVRDAKACAPAEHGWPCALASRCATAMDEDSEECSDLLEEEVGAGMGIASEE